MTNEQLAGQIQAGDRGQLLSLWRRVERYASAQARRWVRAMGPRAGMELEDFQQTAFLALLDALEGWKAGAGFFPCLVCPAAENGLYRGHRTADAAGQVRSPANSPVPGCPAV